MKDPNRLHQVILVSCLLTAALFLLPLILVEPLRPALLTDNDPVDETEQTPAKEVAPAIASPVSLQVLHEGLVVEMGLEEYLVGVLRAEMPASFEPEALKAQAVAARTYTLYKIHTGGNHSGTADICTDHTCCQAWMSEASARSSWGQSADKYEAKLRAAVAETAGQAMFYAGEPILAVFHSSSSGLTRSSGEVWQSSLPYLQAVASPEDADGIPNYHSEAVFTAQEFRAAVLAAWPEADLSGSVSGWLSDPVTDEAGSVDTLCVGGITIKGTQLRSLLGLRSACFTWETAADRITFYVTGYGHGVGMSQYGANAMAEDGADWQEILTHYYTGITIHSINS